MDHDDLDEDIERLKIILQDEDGEEDGDSDGELRVLETNEDEYYSNASRPSTSSDVTASSFPTTSVCTDADDALFRFDPNTITAETCLAMNRAYQEVLLDTLRQIELSLMENRNRQKELEENVDEKVKKTDKQTNREIYAGESRYMPFFRDKDGQIPPYNDDVKLKERMNEEKQHVKPKISWTKKQRKMLIDAIKLGALEQAVRPLLNRQEVEMEKLTRCKNTEEIEECKARIEKLQQDIKQKQETPADELLKNCDSNKIDFLKIAVVTFGNRFSVVECESMWNTVLRPGINRDKWTIAEEEDLNKLAEKYQMRNWKKIAEELGSNRTPFQCLQHYQQNNIVYENTEWTEEEDELLKEVVETCTYGVGRVKWHQVAYYIDRRSADQCHSRWNKLNPNRITGRWSKEEDLQLVNAIHLHGGVTDWNKLQELVPTRTAAQCRERFVYRMSGNVLFKPWKYEDDKKLLQLHQVYGSNWARIAKEFEGRTDNMLLLRYKRLMKWERLSEDFFNQSRKLQKQQKHPAFKFGYGVLIPKSGLKLCIGKKGPPLKADILCVRKKSKTELEKLKEIGGRDAVDDDDDDDDNNDDDIVDDNDDNNDDAADEKVDPEEEKEEDGDDDDDDDEQKNKNSRDLQDRIDSFLSLYNIQAYDYYKQIKDREQGDIVVPRPPPVKKQKMNIGEAYFKKQDKLQDVVATQIDVYIRNLQKRLQDETSESSPVDLNLYDQISRNLKLKKGNEEEKRRMITAAFGGRNPCHLSVRELLNISKCIKEHGKPPKDPKRYNLQPWEVETSEEEKDDVESSEVEEEEEVEPEPKEKKPRSEKQIAHAENWKIDVRKHHAIKNQIRRLIFSKMDPKELNKACGRQKKFLMYPKHMLMKYKGLVEERRLNRKSLVLLMKTLDLDAKKAFFKAKRGKRKVSAMALLKATEKANLRRAKTRRQKTEIQEAAKIEANINSEISEVSDHLLELQDELKIDDDETEENMSVDENEDVQEDKPGCLTFGYNKSLPYIPPNKTNLMGMKSILLEHRYLIDRAGMYFNAEDLKDKLYQLKQRGPNPLMGVLNAIGKTESIVKRRENKKNIKLESSPMVCRKRLEKVRSTTDYQKLKARFQSLFTWPALLATIQPPKGKPLPQSLQNIEQLKPKVSNKKANTEQTDEAVAQTENTVEEDVEPLDEEQAIERLVDKIMEEYEKERVKKRRNRILPKKKSRHVSEKRKQAFVDKERTKVLKRLGLYDKMQDYKRRRLEVDQTMATLNSPSTATSTVSSAAAQDAEGNGMENKSSVGLDLNGVNDTAVNASDTAGPIMNTSEGCQADFPPEDGMTDIAVKTEIFPKRKRGRPPGSKTKRFSNTSPQRKSQRDNSVVVKLEQDYEMSPPKKRTIRNMNGTQYNFVRTLIPSKMSKIASHIPELPILNEPIPEKPVKPKKQKIDKPKPERKRVYRSKFAKEHEDARIRKEKGEFAKMGPKSGRLLSQLKEAEARAAEEEAEKKNNLPDFIEVKTEPIDSDDEDSAENTNNYNVTAPEQVANANNVTETEVANVNNVSETEVANVNVTETEVANVKNLTESEAATVNNVTETEVANGEETEMSSSKKIMTSRFRKSLQEGKNKSFTTVNEKTQNPVPSENQGVTQEQKDDIKNSSGNIKDVDSAMNKTVETPGTEKVQSQNGNQQVSNGRESRKPLIIAVPVMIGGTQQVACIPFYPDDEGKVTLPNGKKIDAASAGDQGAVSLPMLNFDQPLQIIDPNQQSINAQSTAQQTGTSVLNQSTSVPNPGTSILKQGASAPNPDTSILKQGTSAPNPGTSILKQGASAPNPGTSMLKQGASAPNPSTSIQKQGASAPNPSTSIQKQGTSAPHPATSIQKQGTSVPNSDSTNS